MQCLLHSFIPPLAFLVIWNRKSDGLQRSRALFLWALGVQLVLRCFVLLVLLLLLAFFFPLDSPAYPSNRRGYWRSDTWCENT